MNYGALLGPMLANAGNRCAGIPELLRRSNTTSQLSEASIRFGEAW